MGRLTAGSDERVTSFFERLYRHAEGGCLEVRCLGDKPARSEWFNLWQPDLALRFARPNNEAGYDVFFGVNPRIRNGQDDDSVLAGVALWADLDGLGSEAAAEAALEKALEFPLKVDMAVYSGNGLHLYSVLKLPVDPAGEDWSLYCCALRGFAKQFGGDTKCTNPSRVLRFPLLYSHKRGRQTLLWMSGE